MTLVDWGSSKVTNPSILKRRNRDTLRSIGAMTVVQSNEFAMEKIVQKELKKRNSNPIIWSEILEPKDTRPRESLPSPIWLVLVCSTGLDQPGYQAESFSKLCFCLIHGVLILIEPVANYNLLISITTHLTSLSPAAGRHAGFATFKLPSFFFYVT